MEVERQTPIFFLSAGDPRRGDGEDGNGGSALQREGDGEEEEE